MMNNYIILLQKNDQLETEADVDFCIKKIRRIPLDTLLYSGEAIKFLAAHEDHLKIQDKILLSYLVKNAPEQMRKIDLKDFTYQPMPLPPKPTQADADTFYKELEAKISPLAPGANDSIENYKQCELLMQKPEYQFFGLLTLSAMAFHAQDIDRVEQLGELIFRCGWKDIVSPLVFALLKRNQLAKAKPYEPYLVKEANGNGDPTNSFSQAGFSQGVLIWYCLATNNKQIFLDWVRTYKQDDMLVTDGLRKLVIACLEKWGEPMDMPLLDYLRKTPAKSPLGHQWMQVVQAFLQTQQRSQENENDAKLMR
jgi:hypothetical protein